MFFQKVEYTVHRSSLAATVNEDILSRGAAGEPFKVCIRRFFSGNRRYLVVESYEDLPALDLQVVADREEDFACLFNILLQLFCSGFFRLGRSLGQDYRICALPVMEKADSRAKEIIRKCSTLTALIMKGFPRAPISMEDSIRRQ